MDEEVDTQNTNTSDSLDVPSPSNVVDEEVRPGSPDLSRPESRNEPRSRQISRTSSSRDRDLMDDETREKIMKILQEGRIAMEAEGGTPPNGAFEGGSSLSAILSLQQSSSANLSPELKVPRQIRRKPVVLPLPLLAERRNSEGRKRRAPASREYDPVEHHSAPVATKRKSKSSFDPNSALQSLSLDTVEFQDPSSPTLSSPRSDRQRSKNSNDPVPPYIQKNLKKEVKKDILSPVRLEDPNFGQTKKKRRKRGAAARMLTRKKRSTISRDELKSESQDFSKSMMETSSEESEDESEVNENQIDFGNDGIKYLKSLDPKLERSTRKLEKKFRKEFFLRTVLFPPEANSKNTKPTINENVRKDEGANEEKVSPPGSSSESKSVPDIVGTEGKQFPDAPENGPNSMEIDQKPLLAEIKEEVKEVSEPQGNPFDNFMKRYSLAASHIVQTFQSERFSVSQITKILKSASRSSKFPTFFGIRFDKDDFKAFSWILKKIHIQRKIILSSKSAENSMVNMFVKSKELASRIPLTKNKCFLKVHDFILLHGSEDVVYAYLAFLSYLKSADSKYEFIDDHHLNKLKEISSLMNDVLKTFVKDPFVGMMKKWKRMFLLPDVHIIAFHCGTDFRGKAEIEGFDDRRKSILRSFKNLGASVEEFCISDDWYSGDIIQKVHAAYVMIHQTISQSFKKYTREIEKNRFIIRKKIFLVCFDQAGSFVHIASQSHRNLYGIIDFGFRTIAGEKIRGIVGDNICNTACPSLLILGTDSKFSDIRHLEIMKKNFIHPVGSIVVGNSDHLLKMDPDVLVKHGITQSCVDRLIMEHVADFVDYCCVTGDLITQDERTEEPFSKVIELDEIMEKSKMKEKPVKEKKNDRRRPPKTSLADKARLRELVQYMHESATGKLVKPKQSSPSKSHINTTSNGFGNDPTPSSAIITPMRIEKSPVRKSISKKTEKEKTQEDEVEEFVRMAEKELHKLNEAERLQKLKANQEGQEKKVVESPGSMASKQATVYVPYIPVSGVMISVPPQQYSNGNYQRIIVTTPMVQTSQSMTVSQNSGSIPSDPPSPEM
ncbi:hypothetical protein FO519_005238 [Halicephalobus sp. NKZ332]|nr:hypothetical protein FO519_005238 [Halicephalobus sp. NKZ332]